MENLVIGIEGLVGAGKTSICRQLLQKIPNTILLNGGNLYRAIVCAMIENKNKINLDLKKIDIKQMMDLFKIELKIEDNETKIYVDGKLAQEEELQSKDTSLAVSYVGGQAKNEALFEFSRNLINDLKKEHNVIISGRSIMEIYPNTDYHFFITASLEERVKRKCIQYKGEVDEQEVRKNIIKRDELQEKAGFYKLHNNTIQVDVTNCKTIEESTEIVLKQIKLPSINY